MPRAPMQAKTARRGAVVSGVRRVNDVNACADAWSLDCSSFLTDARSTVTRTSKQLIRAARCHYSGHLVSNHRGSTGNET